MFDLSIEKLLILAVLAVVIFGPDQLPKLAAQAGQFLREIRKIADVARNDLREGLGPEFAEFDIADLSPRHFVSKHLLDGFSLDDDEDREPDPLTAGNAATSAVFEPGERPPFDAEAT